MTVSKTTTQDEIRNLLTPGDYSCVTCGMGMMEPCEHWRGILARSAGEKGAALEDRQEAAPEVGLRIDYLINYADSIQSDTIYLDPDDIAFIHEYYGCKTGCCTKFAGKLMKPKVGVVPGIPAEATQLSQHQYLSTACSHGQCFECRKSCKFCGARCTHGCHKSVPSEATPSKENAPLGSESCTPCPKCGAVYVRIFCRTCGEDLDVPAPEVQGTPTKSNVAHQPWCASAPRPVDVPMGRGPYPCDCGTVKAAPAPVGTPQEETPPSISAESSSPLQLAEEKTAPEGVQGKEPQVWRPLVELVRREMMARFSDKLSMEEIASCAYAISTANYSEGAPPMKTFSEFWETVTDSEIEDGIEDVAKRAYLSGEAAGRRSAITLVKEWAKNGEGLNDLFARLDELQEKTK